MDWYKQGPIECIDAMESAFGVAYMAIFCRINAMKYLWRSRFVTPRVLQA